LEFPIETYLPQKTIFKKGSHLMIAAEAMEFGAEGVLVHGPSLEKSGRKKEILEKFPSSARVESFKREGGEPTLDEVSAVIELARRVGAKWIAGVGGGGVIDSAKAAAGLFNAKEQPVYYQEGGALKEKGIPFIAAPTTAGTGSEATINSVIINSQKKQKLSIRDSSFIARKVILDVELLKGMPHKIMSHSSMDALVQSVESYVSKYSSWFTESLSLKAIRLINDNIINAFEKPGENSLSSLLLGSYYAGIALAHARLGVIHGLAHPLGALYNLPHGLICAACFVPSIKLNREAMGIKYEIISDIVNTDLMEWAMMVVKKLNIVSPFKGVELIEKEKIIDETVRSGSTAANPKKIEPKDVEFLLGELF
jgi:alcohol dehydrogenase class IV